MNASLLFLFLGLASSYLVIRPLATLVHELGHVLGLRLGGMRGEMRVYLGSLGESKGAWSVRIGKTTWLLHPRGLLMRGGLSDYDMPVQTAQLLLATLAGPFASLLLSATTITLALVEWSAGPVSLVLLLLGVIACIDAVLSLLYRYTPITLSNARVTANDGQMIGWCWRFGAAVDAYLHARWLFEKDRYAEAIPALQAMLALGHTEKLLYEYLMYAQLMMHQPQDAIDLYERLVAQHAPDAYDHCLHALAQEYLGNAVAAQAALEAAIAIAPGHPEALNHRAFLAVQAGRLDAAATDLHRALRSNPEFAAAYSNRAAVFLARGSVGDARRDLQIALKIDHENPYTHQRWAVLLAMEGDAGAAEAALANARLLGLHE